MTMLLYHLLAERLRDWRAQRKAAREINALLRGCGFVETAPRDWQRLRSKGRELMAKAPPLPLSWSALMIVRESSRAYWRGTLRMKCQ
jgi:hypothetical protein